MLATISKLPGLVGAVKKAAAQRGYDEATLYARAGVTKAQVDALATQLAGIDDTTLWRIMNVTRTFIGVQQFNAYDGQAEYKPDTDITVTHNRCVSSVLGDLSA